MATKNNENVTRSCQSDTKTTPRQTALNNLQRLNEAVDRFGKQVENGTIAPPTSSGRWK